MKDKILYLMQGISASGKSFITDCIREYCSRYHGPSAIFSTDSLWYDSDGIYQFDPKRLGEMHKKNQERVRNAMSCERPIHHIIVDNTNTTQREAQPYLDLAKEFGYTVQVISISCNMDVAKIRNRKRPVDRMVPEEVIEKQNSRMQRISL